MEYFPLYVDISNKKILLVGGGNIASDKLEKLLYFTKDITVIANDINKDMYQLIKDNCLAFYQRKYRSGDIDSFDIVVVATDTVDLHKAIFVESRGKGILVNSVDNTQYCDFIFPSFIKRGDLVVAFSTSGASPAFAKYLRKYFETLIPQNVSDFLQKMKNLRTQLPKGKERMNKFDLMVKEFFEDNFKNK